MEIQSPYDVKITPIITDDMTPEEIEEIQLEADWLSTYLTIQNLSK